MCAVGQRQTRTMMTGGCSPRRRACTRDPARPHSWRKWLNHDSVLQPSSRFSRSHILLTLEPMSHSISCDVCAWLCVCSVGMGTVRDEDMASKVKTDDTR